MDCNGLWVWIAAPDCNEKEEGTAVQEGESSLIELCCFCCCSFPASFEMSKCWGRMAGRADDGRPFISVLLLRDAAAVGTDEVFGRGRCGFRSNRQTKAADNI
jgi:hypothetical protein